jgi:hypothetical protein
MVVWALDQGDMKAILAAAVDVPIAIPSTRELLLQLLVLIALGVAAWLVNKGLERLKKNHIEPLTQIITGGPKQPDLREMSEGISQDIRNCATNIATVSQGVSRLQEEVLQSRTDSKTQIESIRGEVSSLDKRQSEAIAELRGHLDEHGKQIASLQSSDKNKTDRLARIETIVRTRSSDREMHQAAVSDKEPS